jgi:hypothetical protein
MSIPISTVFVACPITFSLASFVSVAMIQSISSLSIQPMSMIQPISSLSACRTTNIVKDTNAAGQLVKIFGDAIGLRAASASGKTIVASVAMVAEGSWATFAAAVTNVALELIPSHVEGTELLLGFISKQLMLELNRQGNKDK